MSHPSLPLKKKMNSDLLIKDKERAMALLRALLEQHNPNTIYVVSSAIKLPSALRK